MNVAAKSFYQKYKVSTVLRSKLNNISKLVGSTPMYRLSNITDKSGVEVYAKLEWMQLGGSIKTRPAYQIIVKALENGDLFNGQSKEGKILLDASSGNTAIAYASIASSLGLKTCICLPENASKERKTLLKVLGAQIIETSRFEGTDGAQKVAVEMVNEFPGKYFYADQYSNVNNWKSHLLSTGPEILEQTSNRITHFITGLGTTGTFTGVSRYLNAAKPGVNLIALQPDHPLHGLEGWKHLETAKVPAIYDPGIQHHTIEVDTLESYDMIKYVSRKEGLLLSPSAAANLVGAKKLADQINQGVIVTTFPDSSDKYHDLYQSLF